MAIRRANPVPSPAALPSLDQQRGIRSAVAERLPSRLAADRGTYVDFAVLVQDPALVPRFNDTHFNPTVLVPSGALISNLTAALAAARPQFVVTIGTRSHFSYMESLPLQMRHGWTHFNGPDEFTARALESLYWHALHYPGGAPGEALVSVFTKAVIEETSMLTTYHSLLGQTHRNWEWLVYCDAWLDEKHSQSSWSLLKYLAASDYRVRPLKGSPNDGAMTCPVRMMFGDANGELLAQVEAGGELLPHALALLSDAAQDNSGAALFFADHVHAGAAKNATQFVTDKNTTAFALDTANGVGLYHELSSANNSFPSWMTGCTLFSLTADTAKNFARKPGPFLAWRRPFYNALGGHASGLVLAADYELVTRMALRNYSAVHVRHLVYMPPPQNGDDAQVGGASLTSSLTQRVADVIAKNAASKPGSREGTIVSSHLINPESAHSTNANAGSGSKPFWEVWHPSARPALATPWHLQASPSATHPKAPFVSVVISTYNRADALLHAIRSVYAQTYRNWELVIVGDGCPNLDEFMNEHASFFAHAGHRVRWFNMHRHKDGSGGHAPRNYAVQVLASGAWIAYLDDDNAWTHDHLASLVLLVRQDPERSFAFASLQIGSKVLLCDQPKLKRIDTSALLHRADLIRRYGSWRAISDIPLGYGQDWDLVSRWLDGGEQWAASLQPTVLYHSLRLQQGNVDEGSYADSLIRAYDAFVH